MTLELRPLGVACNLSCTYCYQDPQRDSGNFRQSYDLERMKAALTQAGGPFLLFGGEPLLVPLTDLEELWRFGLERHGKNGVQTNGALITDEHMALFQRYKVDVGISIDGPGECNDLRWNGSLEKTRAATARTEAAIERLCREWRPPSLIVTLHRQNAVAEKLPLLHEWLQRLDGLGVTAVRLHLLEVDAPGVRQHHTLSPRQNVEALRSMAALQGRLKKIRFDMMTEMSRLLRGDDSRTSCVWHACDPYTTEAVRGIEGNGQSSNCGRTNKDGIDFTKAAESGYERYLALYSTPQEHGGCQGCRFFLMCKGQCPGTAIDGDWRNRTEHCAVWMALFTELERQLLRAGHTPLTLLPVRRWLEGQLVAEWAQGRNSPLCALQRAAPPPPPPPRFCRISWVSDAARDLWHPRLERIAALQGEWAQLRAARGLPAVPACCAAFRQQLPTDADPIWAMAGAAARGGPPGLPVTVAGGPHGNVLLQRLGVRAVQHQPCSFDCAATAAIARDNLALGREAGWGQEMDWLEEILSFAASWTALHGIAEIKTPVFRMITESEYTAERRVLHHPGVTEVSAAGRGLGFPYQAPRRASQLRVMS